MRLVSSNLANYHATVQKLLGRGQGHVSNFYIADLENFTTASRR